MRYVSTRGQAPPVSFTEAILAGMAPDGGLYVPEAWPSFSPHAIDNGFSAYENVASRMLAAFSGDTFTLAERNTIVRRAYDHDVWGAEAITPLRELGPGMWLLDLTRGPSLAFKDVAMQLIASLYDHVLETQDRRLSVVCATSGDTGGAAVAALKGRERVDLFVLLPKGRVSEVQRRFMTTANDAHVHAIEVEGDFDACQAIVKSLFADTEFAHRASLSGVNSINWARIVAQAVYFMRAAHALGSAGLVDFAVPTGNFGDAYSAYVAKMLGAPIRRIGVATNSNDILPRALKTGRYQKQGASVATISPAMDIQVASNFERLVYEMTGRDGGATAALFNSLTQTGGFDIPPDALAQMRLHFTARAVSETDTKYGILRGYAWFKELFCPHTAVALQAFQGTASGAPNVLLATAHPAKFRETVRDAARRTPTMPPQGRRVMRKPEQSVTLPADANAVKQFIRERSRAWT